MKEFQITHADKTLCCEAENRIEAVLNIHLQFYGGNADRWIYRYDRKDDLFMVTDSQFNSKKSIIYAYYVHELKERAADDNKLSGLSAYGYFLRMSEALKSEVADASS